MNQILSDLKAKRLNHGISQSKLAKLYGLSPASLSAWELGKLQPDSMQLEKWITSLNELVQLIESKKIDIKKKKILSTKGGKRSYASEIRDAYSYRKIISKLKRKENEYTKSINEIYKIHLANNNESKLRAISLFSGCGGLDLGFSAAGFSILGHIELDKSIEAIYRANFPQSITLGYDITRITEEEITSWKNRFGEIDVIIGGPPCQGFSLAGKRDPEDARNKLYEYYAKILRIVRPKVFVMENVSLLTSMKTKEGNLVIENIKNEFSKSGYSMAIKEIDVKEYGVPQSRNRIVIVGTRNGEKEFRHPEPSHSGNDVDDDMYYGLFDNIRRLPYRTFRDATHDLPIIESGETSDDPLHWGVTHPKHVIEWLRDVPEGCSAHDNENPALRPSSGFNTTYKRVKWDEPCSTISTNFGMISGSRNVHPSSTRSFSVREAARVQSFSDDFIFIGNWSAIRKSIGNAVPPLFAYSLACAVRNQLFS